jgi:glucose/arabinose dehydrogenase
MVRPQRVKEVLATGLIVGLLSTPPVLASQAPVEEVDVQEALDELVAIQIAGPFEFPWSIGFLPDGAMLVTDKPGRLRLAKPGSKTREIRGLPPIRSGDQGG